MTNQLPDDLQKKLEKWEANKPQNQQLQVLSDLAVMMQEQLNVLDAIEKGSQTNAKDHGRLLIDMKEKLDSLNSKEAPEMPDYAKPVLEGFKDLKTALSASIKGIDVKPVVNVPKLNAPAVNVSPPSVDLKGVEKVLKTDLPKAFDKAIKSIPQPKEVKIPDYSKKFDEMTDWLKSIDTATRLKVQFPGTLKVTNPDGTTVGGGATNYATKIDEDSVTSGIFYVGKAAIGSSAASAVWQIKKLNTTSIDLDKTWCDGDDSFNNIWANRESLTYS